MSKSQEQEYVIVKDGNQWGATGKGFIDLASSDNVAFGKCPIGALHKLLVWESSHPSVDIINCTTCQFSGGYVGDEPCKSCRDFKNWRQKESK